MKSPTHWSMIVAGTIAIGAFTWSPAHAQQDPAQPGAAERAGQAVDNAAQKTGEAAKKAVDKTEQAVGLEASDDASKNATAIRGVIAEVAEASLTKEGLDDVAERFSEADRNRLGQTKEALKNNAALDGRIDQFQKDWKAKYNQDFKIPDKDAVYPAEFVMISQGDEARLASAKIDPAAPASTDTNARNFAIAMIPPSHGMPSVAVPLVHEAGGWKINIPDAIDSNKLRDNVQTALTKCGEKKDQWPSDVNDAYRGVTHELLIAVIGAPTDGRAAQPAAGQLPADPIAPAAPAAPADPTAPADPAAPAAPQR